MRISVPKLCKPMLNQVCRFMAIKGVDVATMRTIDRKIQTKHSNFSGAEILIFQYVVAAAIDALSQKPKEKDIKLLNELFYLNDRITNKYENYNKSLLQRR